jgi:hypothetical protein
MGTRAYDHLSVAHKKILRRTIAACRKLGLSQRSKIVARYATEAAAFQAEIRLFA